LTTYISQGNAAKVLRGSNFN